MLFQRDQQLSSNLDSVLLWTALIVHTGTVQTLLGTCEECEIGFLLDYSFRNCPRASIRCFQRCAARDSMLHSQHNFNASFFFLVIALIIIFIIHVGSRVVFWSWYSWGNSLCLQYWKLQTIKRWSWWAHGACQAKIWQTHGRKVRGIKL